MSKARAVGLVDVARLAKVSTATVSNALNRPEIVAQDTRERVLAASAQLGFIPSSAARSLRHGTSRIVGLVVPDITNPFYAAIADGVATAADAADYSVALCVTGDDPLRELRQVRLLTQQRAAGALVVPRSAPAERLNGLRDVGTHIVLVDRQFKQDVGCSVAIDDTYGGRLAAEHLIRGGARRLAMVNGPLSIEQCRDRLEGARAALREGGIAEESLVQYTVAQMTIESGERVAADLLRVRPEAVFCTNDQLATGVIRGLLAGGVNVPQDIAVVGYGDLSLATDGLLTLTTVAQPKEALGRAAVGRLIAEAADVAHLHTTTTFQPSLVVRASAP